MTDSDKQELQALRDEVTKLKYHSNSTYSILLGILTTTSVTFLTHLLLFNKAAVDACTAASSALIVASLVFFPGLVWLRVKGNKQRYTTSFSPNGANYPSPGCNPGYPDKNDISPERAP